MKKLTYLKMLFVLIAISVSTVSCKKEEITDHGLSDYELSLRNQGLDNFSETVTSIWTFAYDKYSRETLCNCDENSVIAFVDLMNNHQYLLPAEVRGLKYSTDYDVIFDAFRLDCQFPDELDKTNKIHEYIDNSPLTAQESLLIKDLLEDSKDGIINKEDYTSRYNQMNSHSNISAILIENAFAVEAFINGNPDIFDDPPQALWVHIGAGIASGLVSAIVQTVWDSIDDYGLTEEQLIRGMTMSAIGGAVLAR